MKYISIIIAVIYVLMALIFALLSDKERSYKRARFFVYIAIIVSINIVHTFARSFGIAYETYNVVKIVILIYSMMFYASDYVITMKAALSQETVSSSLVKKTLIKALINHILFMAIYVMVIAIEYYNIDVL